MIKINYEIPQSTLELLMQKIFVIIADEIEYQVTNGYIEPIKIFVEKQSASDDSECPLINISLAGAKPTEIGAYGTEQVEYMFCIEIVTVGSKTTTGSASYNSAIKNQRLYSVIRYILNHPSYKTLGTNKISTMGIKKLDIVDIDTMDTRNTARENIAKMRMSRLYFSVTAIEENEMPQGTTIINQIDLRFKDTTSETGYHVTI